jgi:hypothetical protein
MDKIAESINALAAAVQTAADAYARYVDTYCREAETYRKKYEQEAALRKMAMEHAMAEQRRRS